MNILDILIIQMATNADELQVLQELKNVDKKELLSYRCGDNMTFLHLAALDCKLQIIQYLLEIGMDPNTKNSRGGIPVLAAVGSRKPNRPKILRTFLHYGADLDMLVHGVAVRDLIHSFKESELDQIIEEYDRNGGKIDC